MEGMESEMSTTLGLQLVDAQSNKTKRRGHGISLTIKCL